MKKVLSLRRHAYLKTISTFLIAVVLIFGVVGCEGEPEPEYELTMAVNPPGIGTATDDTGTSPYAEGEVVDIGAHPPDPCYQFVDWTAPAGTFGDVNNATTTFTMPASDVTVTANFNAITLGHFKAYDVSDTAVPPPVGIDVELVDRFSAINATVMEAIAFSNPADKVHGDVFTPMGDSDHHLTLYRLESEQQPQLLLVEVKNQFGDNQELTVEGPHWLAVPTQKEDHEAPACLDHFLVYNVVPQVPEPVNVDLKDQWTEETVTVYEPAFFATPVQKTVGSEVTEIQNPDGDLVFYKITGEPFETSVQIDNQFGPQMLTLTIPALLAVPSETMVWETLILDHFQCFDASWWNQPEEEVVELKDQFHDESFEASLGTTICFCVPTEKLHNEVLTPILYPNNYLMVYSLYHEEQPQEWSVEVDNQFGDQMLTVSGPVALAVPTQNEGHEPPVGLDHFLLYEVIEGTSVNVSVTLQNDYFGPSCVVELPAYFACPVQKTHEAEVMEIQNPEAHVVLYQKSWTGYWDPGPYVHVFNQFVEQEFRLYMLTLVAVPSEKLDWTPLS